jgi:beta-glucanase (GH16 family)
METTGRTSRRRFVVVLCAGLVASWLAAQPMDAAQLKLRLRLQLRPTTSTSSSTTSTTSTTLPSNQSCAALPKAGGGYWQCTFDEEFSGSTLDRSIWVPITTAASGFHSGPECFVDSPNNVAVGGGVLRLTVRREAAPFTCTSPAGDYQTQYTSEQVATYGTFSQTYGRFEVRARVSNTAVPGLQSSLWLWPNNPTKYGQWPSSGEIDIAEMYSAFNDRVIPFVHYNNWLDLNATNNYCLVSDLGQFHTYAVEWTPQSLTFIYDGRTCLVDTWLPLPPQVKPQPFDSPFMVALTQLLGVTNNAFDPANPPPLPASTVVDYVRVWK